ncbi:hypothetical protein SEMRO_2580_G331840.1 [Seminavis robusta]|uniref:Uncharacterized protein n=1 Tax=Seminavis robusta TaxID=568900 RepID=A0A9N8HWA5_9STRA|nr:hypothetical protein SEMRO_2580_G331840.1 [Seminavis robusta]|eukprot:Sro2580_g331840.1 n/a (104) ;mRNA; r:5001-5312
MEKMSESAMRGVEDVVPKVTKRKSEEEATFVRLEKKKEGEDKEKVADEEDNDNDSKEEEEPEPVQKKSKPQENVTSEPPDNDDVDWSYYRPRNQKEWSGRPPP